MGLFNIGKHTKTTLGPNGPFPSPDNPYTYLRSPLAKARRDMFNYAAEPKFNKKKPADILLTIFIMYYADSVVRELHGRAYDLTTFFPNPDKTVAELRRKGFIDDPAPEEVLDHRTIAQLTEFAENQGFIVPKGKKSEVIHSILSEVSPKALKKYCEENYYIKVSARGFKMLRGIYDERVEVELSIAYALMSGQQKKAVKYAQEYSDLRPSLCPVINPMVAAISHPSSVFSALLDAKGLINQRFSMALQYFEYFQKNPQLAPGKIGGQKLPPYIGVTLPANV